ncbi:hypothetical protein FMEAI12_6040010 [Parafrankia sp. Ea1.12]|nr:hypothetical protein FMEAI12_6040010 [Parafrankia sp. Ea1.12]
MPRHAHPRRGIGTGSGANINTGTSDLNMI